MKRQVQEVGTRQWHGDDVVMLQDSAFTAIEDAILKDVGNCVLKPPVWTSATVVGTEGYLYIDGQICLVETGTYTNPVWFTKLLRTEDSTNYDVGGTTISKAKTKQWIASPNATSQANSIKYEGGDTETETLQNKIVSERIATQLVARTGANDYRIMTPLGVREFVEYRRQQASRTSPVGIQTEFGNIVALTSNSNRNSALVNFVMTIDNSSGLAI